MVENTIDSSLNVCKYSPITRGDIIIAIVESEKYFVSSTNGTTIWEICDNGETQQTVKGANIVTLDSECYVKTTSFMVKPHQTKVFNQTQTVKLQLSISNASLTYLANLAQKSSSNYNFTDSSPVVIHGIEDMENLIKDAAVIAQQADHDYKFTNLTLETGLKFDSLKFDFKFLTWMTTGITWLIVGVASIILIYVLWKLRVFAILFKNIGFSPKLSKRGEIVVDLNENTTKAYPNTPHPKRNKRMINESSDGENEQFEA